LKQSEKISVKQSLLKQKMLEELIAILLKDGKDQQI